MILISETIKGEHHMNYFDHTGHDDILSGGVKMIPINTPAGKFKVWTKRTGHNPKAKVLILHGGPGATHELYEPFDSWMPGAGIEYYYYDQLGSYYSDQPDDDSLWDTDRFVEEVEQVRQALNLDKTNFILYGQSWGGLLAMEYALKYQQHLKGLIISNMGDNIPDYTRYNKEVLSKKMPAEVWSEISQIEADKDFQNPRYMELLMKYHYPEHVLRMAPENWPEPVNRTFKHLNEKVYVPMQGQSEFGITPGAKLEHWDRSADIHNIKVPTLVIGATYDTMDPEQMKVMAGKFPYGVYLHCANGSHLCIYDDQETYFKGMTGFINKL
jgi:proline iminopeptidase